MILLANTTAEAGMKPAIAMLKSGKSGIDALVDGIGFVEADERVRSVGYGGWPNMIGEMECDAGVMDGSTRKTGAVGAVKDTLHVAELAKAVMERLPHVLLTGDGARRFADEIGMPRQNMLHPDSKRVWRETLEPLTSGELDPTTHLIPLTTSITDPERVRDTTVFLGQDMRLNQSVATSTSGWAWKYPGRLGDSPISGAGFYSDSRFGSSACTHTGEMAIRGATSARVVHGMEMGLSINDAVVQAAADLAALSKGYIGEVVIHAIDTSGGYKVIQIHGEKPVTYWIWTEGMAAPERRTAEVFDGN